MIPMFLALALVAYFVALVAVILIDPKNLADAYARRHNENGE